MAVRIVTDSSSGIPADLADELGITVLDLHVMEDEEVSTSGLSSLELAAAYARQLERGGDDGIVALHLSKRLSSTWSAGVSASAVFDDAVRVVDTDSAGMAVGAAAIVAASFARAGANLDGCAAAAEATLAMSETWLYLRQLDDMRKSGRLSATTAMLSAALLATKPILRVNDGKLELAIKTRTQSKAFTKLVNHVVEHASGNPVFAAIQYSEDEDSAQTLAEMLEEELVDGSSVELFPLTAAVAAHTGEGAIALSVFYTGTENSTAS